MTHRREFLKRAVRATGLAAAAPLVEADRALASTLDALGARPRLSASDAGARRLREEYLLAPGLSYLNHASIGTIPRVVHDAHRAYLAICETHPWLYMWGGAWEEPRERVRERAGAALRCPATDVAITHNTTEGFNLLAQGLPLGRGDEVLFSSLNHDGASVCFRHHGAARGYAVRSFPFPLERIGSMTAEEVVGLHVEQIRPATRLLVFPHVDNIVGVRHPLAELTAAAHRHGVEFVAVDGAQTVGMLEVDLGASGVDFYAASPHKWLQAPKGLGLFYARAGSREALRPMWVTWGQNRWAGTIRRFEDYGTRNLPGVLALGDALDFQAALGVREKVARYRVLFERLHELAAATPGFGWRSPAEWDRGASLVSVSVEGLDAPEFSRRMMEEGYVFRPFRLPGLNAVRLSPNVFTTTEELERFFDLGKRVLNDA